MRMSVKHLAGLVMLVGGAMVFGEGAATGPAAPEISGKLGKPIELFNGKDIDGWTWIGGKPKGGGEVLAKEAVWSVVDGVLHCNGKEVAGFASGYLREGLPFTNYVLTVEQRHVTKGGGGILIAIMGEDRVWPKNLQIQGTFGDVGDFVNQYGIKMTTDKERTKAPRGNDVVIKKMAATSEHALGEWDTVVTVADHGKVWVTVNGVLQNVGTDTEPLTGTIGLQAEGAVMEFRKIEVTPIE
jgi:Domain of Unknown Function (DUF1080)